MTEKYITYRWNGRTFDVPESQSADVEKNYPDATIEMRMGDRSFDVPLAHKQDALDQYGSDISFAFDREPEVKPEPVAAQEQQPSFAPAEDDTKKSRREQRRERWNDRLVAANDSLSRAQHGLTQKAADAAMDKATEAPDERPSWGESFVKGAGAGFTRAGKGLYDALIILSSNNTYIDPLTGELVRTPDYDTLMKEQSDPMVQESLKAGETAERLSKEADPTGGEKGFVDLISEGKIGMALQKGLATGAESLPMTLSAYNPYTMALNMVSMAGANYAEQTLENPEVDKWKRATQAIGSAALEQAVEKFADPIFKYIGGGNTTGEFTESIAREILEDGTREATESISKRILNVLKGTAKDALGEGAEEVITSFGNDALGEALDLIDGDKDYGIRAQWEQMKEENPDASLKDFAADKAKEYMDSFIGGALSGAYMSGTTQSIGEAVSANNDRNARNAMTSSYEMGASMDYGDMYDTDADVSEAAAAAESSFVGENGESSISSEFIDSLSAEDAFALSRREEISPEQRRSLGVLALAKARQEGLNKKLDERLENNIAEARSRVADATENGQVVSGMYNGRVVYVKGGVVNNGSVSLTADGVNGPVVVVDTVTGEKTTVNSDEIISASTLDAETLGNDIETYFRDNEYKNRDAARNTMSPRAKTKAVQQFAGRKVMVDLGNGLTEIEVQRVNPKSGTAIIKGKKGDLGGRSIIEIGADVIYDSIYRDEDGNPVLPETLQPEAPQAQPEHTPQAEEPQAPAQPAGSEDFRDFTGTIVINGVPVNVEEVTAQDNTADRITYTYTDENGNRKTASTTIGGFAEAVNLGMQNQPADAPAPTPVVPEAPAEDVPVPTTPEVPTGSTNEVPLTPEGINWDALFDEDPEAYFAEVQKQFGDEALDVLNEEIQAAQQALDALAKAKTSSQNERLENRKKKAALAKRIEVLNGMVARLTAAPEATAETPAVPEVAPVGEQPAAPAAPDVPQVPAPTDGGYVIEDGKIINPTVIEMPSESGNKNRIYIAEKDGKWGYGFHAITDDGHESWNDTIQLEMLRYDSKEDAIKGALSYLNTYKGIKKGSPSTGIDAFIQYVNDTFFPAGPAPATPVAETPEVPAGEAPTPAPAVPSEPAPVSAPEAPATPEVPATPEPVPAPKPEPTPTPVAPSATKTDGGKIGRTAQEGKAKISKIIAKSGVSDFVGTDKTRPAMTGVYKSGGYEYASDSSILAKIRASYPSEQEGKIISPKTGQEINGRYPNADMVVESALKSNKPVSVSVDDIIAYAYAMEEVKRGFEKGKKLYVKIGNDIFRSDLLFTAAKLAKKHGLTEILQSETVGRAMAFNGNNGTILVMPMNGNSLPSNNFVDISDGKATFDNYIFTSLKVPSTLKGIEAARDSIAAILPNMDVNEIGWLTDTDVISLRDGKIYYNFSKRDISDVKNKAKDPNTYNALDNIENNGLEIPLSESEIAKMFPEKHQDTGNPPVNSVPLTQEPNGENNGEQGEDAGNGQGTGNTGGGTGNTGNQAENPADKAGEPEQGKGDNKGGEKSGDVNKYPARKGNATQKLLVDTFGFASVKIPNSRKNTLNSIYDFMMAMAKILGISPKSIGNGGWVSVESLNARNHASASHTLTSMTVDQTVVASTLRYKYDVLSGIAHEWWHALDHVLSYFNTGKGRTVASELPKSKFTGREETYDAVQQVVQAIEKSGHEKRMKSLGFPLRYTLYLLEKSELVARAFDEYIKMKFAEVGITIEGVSYVSHEIQPTKEEMAVIAPALDNLFKVLKEKEGKTSGTTVLYNIGEEMEPQSDAKKLATEAILTALNEGNRNVEILSDEQAEQYLKMIGADPETQFSIDTDKPIFLSNAAIAVMGIKQEKATPEQWLKMIEKAGGLKAGEDKWMGLSDWLKAHDAKTLTKKEVLDYITANTIRIEEVNYAEIDYFAEDKKLIDAINNEFLALRKEAEDAGEWVHDAGDIAYQKMAEKYGDDFFIAFGVDLGELYVSNREAASIITGIDLGVEREINETRLGYTTEGLKNNKEIAIVVPTIEPWKEHDEIHFGDAGNGRAVAWVRFGDTVGYAPEYAKFYAFQEAMQKKYFPERKTHALSGNDLMDLTIEERAEFERLRVAKEQIPFNKSRNRKVLVIDEIQSKRHQEGREKGYIDAELIKMYNELSALNLKSIKTLDEIYRAHELSEKIFEKLGEQYHVMSKDIDIKDGEYTYDAVVYGREYSVGKRTVSSIDEAKEYISRLANNDISAHNREMRKQLYNGVPDAPFGKNWSELAMKRMLRYAAENGYDAIAWTTGEQQADRYSLAKSFDSIEREDNPNVEGRRFVLSGNNTEGFQVDENGNILGSTIEEARGKALEEVVGKDMAAKMMSLEDGGTIEGEELRIGGEGMKGFYDKMLPAFMNKYGKKWGVKVEDMRLPHVEFGLTMHSVPVTEAMRESVMEGQPMFYKTPNGTVYGWTDGKKIYLTKAGLNPNTPVHEYTHLWAKAMMLRNPKGWESIKKLLKGTPVWNEVINDTNYSNIRNDEDAVASEALSRISGSENAAKMEQMAQKMIDEAKGTGRKLEARGLIQNMKDALNKFWNWVGTNLFGIENFESVEQVTDRVLYDLLNNTDLGTLSEGQVEAQIVTDPKVISELEASPKRTGYRNVVQNEDGTFSSPMAFWLQGTKAKGGAKSRVETAKFELGKWEEAEEHPELVDDAGHVVLVKPDKNTVEVAYDPYIHNRLDPVNLQFKAAWKRAELVYVETEVPETDLNSGYHAEGALLPVGVHSWSNGDLMLSKYDKPVRIVPWEEVADAWVERLNGEGVEFDVVPAALRPLLVERGVEIIPPHKGSGKDCVDAYKAWKDSVSENNSLTSQSYENTEDAYATNDGRGTQPETEGVQGEVSMSKPLGEGRRLARPENGKVSQDGFAGFNPIYEREGESDRQRNNREAKFLSIVNNLTSDERINLYGFLKDYIYSPSGILRGRADDFINSIRQKGNDVFADFVEDFINDELKYREGISAAATAKHGFLVGIPYDASRLEQIFDAYNEDKYNETLFDRAIRLAKRFGVSIKFATRNEDGSFFSAFGNYNPSDNTITLDANLLADGNAAELCQTIVHELIHSVVARAASIMSGRAVDNNKQFIDPLSLPKDVIDGINALKEVYDAIKDDGTFQDTYGKKDFEEMLSEITDPKFRGLLKAKKLWKKFLNGICRILGIADESSSESDALTEIESALDKILSSAERGELDSAYASYLGQLAEGYTLDDLQRLESGPVKTMLTQNKLFRTGIDPTEIATETAGMVYDRVVRSNWQEFQRQFQDAMQPVRIAIDAIQQATGNVPIEDYENYLFAQNQASSRSRVEIDDFARRYYSPIIEQVNKIIDTILEARGYDKSDRVKRAEVYKELRNYLIAKHGLERNKYYQSTKTRKMTAKEMRPELDQAKKDYDDKVNQINADTSLTDAERQLQLRDALDEYNAIVEEIRTREVPDLRDYSGLTSLFGYRPDEFELAEQDAEDAVNQFEYVLGRTDTIDQLGNTHVHQSKLINSLWNRINAATDKTLRHSYESGLLSRQQYEDIKAMFEFYIPLRGFDETTAEDVYSYARFEGNRFNPAVHKAEGRVSIADDPIAIIMNMAESEIAQGNKNRAKQALYNFLLNRPVMGPDGKQHQNSLMQIEDVWYVETVDASGNTIYVIAAPDHAAGESWDDFENRMQNLAANDKAFKSKKGKMDITMRFQKQTNRDAHYVYLKVNGVEKAIYINGDPKAADAINGTYRPESKWGEDKLRTINRLISSAFTNYSLEFTARNYFRDMFYSHINMGIRESDPAYRKKFRQNWRHNNIGSMMRMLKAYRAGAYDGAALTEDEAAFVEFMNNGGQTGYTVINSVENHKKELERAIERMQNGIVKGGIKDSTVFRYTLGGIELLNEVSELVTRFAAFKTSRDMGRGVNASINDAKEITVNFNTKGAQDGKGWMGAVARYFGWSKFFFNASVQGVQNIKAMAEANKLKFCTTVGGIAGLGFCMPIIAGALAEIFGGDDDDESFYWNIPEYDRQNNLCIPVGSRYAKIPLPIGFREVYAIGDMVAAMAFDKKFERDVEQIGMDVANKVASVVLPINPLESSANGLSFWHTALYTALPSALQFPIQNATNIDWKGAPLQKEYTYNENDPQWMKAYASNPDWMTGLSKWCNEHINLDGDYDGMDWSPEKLDNTLSNMFGGIYTLIKKTGKTISMAWNEEERNLSNIPLAGVILGSRINDDERFVTDAYYDMKEYYDKNVSRIKRTAKAFGLSLGDVFDEKKGAHQPKMQEIYGNENFDFMQEWYKGDKELESLKGKIDRREKKLAEMEEPSQELIDEIAALSEEYETKRREFVNDMLEL